MSRTVRPVSAYRLPVRVRFHECGPLGHVNNAVYLNWLEQAAIDHAALAGWSQEELQRDVGGVFVARRHEIDYLRPAYEGEHLDVITWADTMQMATALRRYVVRCAAGPNGTPELIEHPAPAVLEGGEVLVRAVTRWALVTLNPVRPLRIPSRVIGDFIETIETTEKPLKPPTTPRLPHDHRRTACQLDAPPPADRRAAGGRARHRASHRRHRGRAGALRGDVGR